MLSLAEKAPGKSEYACLLMGLLKVFIILQFWKKRLFWHVKLTSRRFSAWTKLESGYCSAAGCAFVTEENTTLQSFQEVHNVVGVLIKEKCLGN